MKTRQELMDRLRRASAALATPGYWFDELARALDEVQQGLKDRDALLKVREEQGIEARALAQDRLARLEQKVEELQRCRREALAAELDQHKKQLKAANDLVAELTERLKAANDLVDHLKAAEAAVAERGELQRQLDEAKAAEALAWRPWTNRKAMRDVAAERARQDKKWGKQNHDPLQWSAILTEEAGEATHEFLEAWAASKLPGGVVANAEKVREYLVKGRTELVQVAAVAVAWIECLDRNEWLWAVAPSAPSAPPEATS